MADQTLDPIKFKSEQRRTWNAAAAGWKRFWPTFERPAQHVSDRLVALAEIAAGCRVLDVATGTGEPALTAARKVGSGGRVVATDQSPAMLSLARERATEAGLHNLEFHETDAEALAIPERDFDAVLSRWGLMFLPDLTAALKRMRSLLKPGGRLAAAVWAEAAKVPLIGLSNDAIRRLAGLPPPPNAPNPLALADPAILQRALADAGFGAAKFERVTVTFEFDSAADLFRYREEVSVQFRTMLGGLAPAIQQQIREAIVRDVAPYAIAGGRIRLPNEAILWSARD